MRIVRLHPRNDVNTKQAIAARTIVASVFLGLAVAAFPAPASATEPVAGATIESPPEAQATPPETSTPPSAQGPRVDAWSGRPLASPAPKAPPVAVTESYGWQIVLADLGGLVGTGLLGAAGVDGLAVVAPYFLASPIVHVAHGNTGTAFGSLGVHVGTPMVGMIVAVIATQTDGSTSMGEGIAALALGALGGMVAATVVDAVFLAHSTVEVPSQMALVPTISIARAGGATVGLAATF